MKNLILFASVMLFFTACKNEKSAPSEPAKDAKSMVVEAETDEMPNQTDFDFDAAIAAFRSKDYKKASQYITIAMDDLKKEDTSTDPKSKEQLASVMTTMQIMADQVIAGKVKTEASLLEMFALVDMMSSHRYLLLTQEYAVKEPEKAQNAFKKASGRVERAVQKMDGDAKKEGNTILADLKAGLAKDDQKANKIGDAAGRQVEKMFAWIKVHAEKLGINPPKKVLF